MFALKPSEARPRQMEAKVLTVFLVENEVLGDGDLIL
jgi:hypothetical protein